MDFAPHVASAVGSLRDQTDGQITVLSGQMGVVAFYLASERFSDVRLIDRYGLTFRDEDVLRTTCSTIEGVLPVNLVRRRVWHGSRRVEASVMGVDAEHLDMFGLAVSRGRPFNEIDAATLVSPDVFNAQQQRRIDWPAHPAVARAQRLRIGRAARAFRSRYGVRHLPYRFDLVTLEGPLDTPRVNWQKRQSEV